MRMYHDLSKQIIANPKGRDNINHDFLETNRKEIKLQRNNHFAREEFLCSCRNEI
jgi:hypothetical protein